MKIPKQGRTKDEILQILKSYRQQDLQWRSGKVMAYVYDPGEDTRDIANRAYMMYLTENALDPTTYPSLLRLENEVVRMVINLLRGGEQVVGNLTSGGTESIMLAIKTARDWARVNKPHIKQPEMILPRTVHSAFHKGAAYFDVKPVVVGFDPVTFHADVAAMRNAINENTILLVGSAPGYAQGVVDPIEAIGALALEHDLLFHVDACVGGIHLSIMRTLGYDVPDFDWSVPGVTSISADMHKFGYAPKNASVIMCRDKALRKYQFFACLCSTTYGLINSTILSTKSGGPMAGSWATLNYLGEEGYSRIVREVMDATRKLVDGINATEGLRVLGTPDMCMFSFASGTINLFELADEMHTRGWYLQPQFATETSPSNLHITVNHSSVLHVDALLKDLRECIEVVKNSKTAVDPAAVRGLLEQAAGSMSPEAFQGMLAMAGIQGGQLPDRLALINAVLDALPDPVAEDLLIDFMNNLYC